MRTLTVSSKELADLQLIINTYESKIAKDSNGDKVSILAFRAMENTNVSLKESYKGLELGQGLTKQVNEWRSALSKEEADLNKAMKGKEISDAINSVLSPDVDVNREAKGTLFGVGIKSKNTFIGVANAGSVGEGLGVIMKDCIPCTARFDAPKLVPDLSFLDYLIKTSNDLINEIKLIIDDVLAPPPTSADICANVNILNFTCLPDFNALSLMLGKGLSVTIKAPKFKLPGLSDLISMILAPVLSMIANLAMAWLNLVVKPIECIIKSIETLIKKLKVKSGATGASIKLGSRSVVAKATLGLSKPQADAYNTAIVGSTTKGLEAILKVIKTTRDKVVAFFKKSVDKYKAISDKSMGFVKAIFENIREVTKIAAYLKLIAFIKSLFQVNLKNCNSKEELSTKVYADVVKKFAAPAASSAIGVTDTGGNPDGRATVSISLEEAASLGFTLEDDPTGKIIQRKTGSRDITFSKGSEGNVNLEIIRSYEDDCQIVSSREQFVSVNTLIQGF